MTVELKGLADKFTEQLAIIFMVGSLDGEKSCGAVVFRRAEGRDTPFGNHVPASPGREGEFIRARRGLPCPAREECLSLEKRERATPTLALQNQTIWEASREKNVRPCYNHLLST